MGSVGPVRPVEGDLAGRVFCELSSDLPEEDLDEDLDVCLEMYRMGSKPRCEEVEYLELVRDARDRIARAGGGAG